MNPIIYFTDFLEIYDQELYFPIPKKRLLKRYFLPITVGKFTLLITSNVKEYLSFFSYYFHFDNKIEKYRNVIVVSLDHSEIPEGIFEKNIHGIKSGFDSYENKIYCYLNSGAKISESGQYINFSIHNEMKNLMFFITKVIENEIIKLHLKLGYLPVHSSLCLNENNTYSLILGNSQSGKTTFCTTNQRILISDELTFLSSFTCLPFGHYYKKYITKDSISNVFIESFQSFEREIHKIEKHQTDEVSLSDIQEIIFLEVGSFESRKLEISSIEEKTKFLLRSLLDIPNHAFLDSSSFSILTLPIVNNIATSKIFIEQRRIT
jgi:hypothetical protein